MGLRGVRIQNIVNELQGEKIDVMEWNRDPAVFITNALSPAQVMKVDLDEDGQYAIAVVPERQLSLAIGTESENARLAARLTGGVGRWRRIAGSRRARRYTRAFFVLPGSVYPPPPNRCTREKLRR